MLSKLMVNIDVLSIYINQCIIDIWSTNEDEDKIEKFDYARCKPLMNILQVEGAHCKLKFEYDLLQNDNGFLEERFEKISESMRKQKADFDKVELELKKKLDTCECENLLLRSLHETELSAHQRKYEKQLLDKQQAHEKELLNERDKYEKELLNIRNMYEKHIYALQYKDQQRERDYFFIP